MEWAAFGLRDGCRCGEYARVSPPDERCLQVVAGRVSAVQTRGYVWPARLVFEYHAARQRMGKAVFGGNYPAGWHHGISNRLRNSNPGRLQSETRPLAQAFISPRLQGPIR